MNKTKKSPIYLKSPLYFLGSIFALIFSFLFINKIGIQIFALKYSGSTPYELIEKACLDASVETIAIQMRKNSDFLAFNETCQKRLVFLSHEGEEQRISLYKSPTISFLSYFSYAEFYYKKGKMRTHEAKPQMEFI